MRHELMGDTVESIRRYDPATQRSITTLDRAAVVPLRETFEPDDRPATFLDFAGHHGFLPRLCQPYRAKTKGKVERFNHFLRYSFYVPLMTRLRSSGLTVDVATANVEVRRWLRETANVRTHAGTERIPLEALERERSTLQVLPPPWRGEIAAARPRREPPPAPGWERPLLAIPASWTPQQHPLAMYERLAEVGT